jgi:hypothetical protein
MANSDKNILITPNTGSSTLSPTIVFRGANNTPVTLRTLDTGTISFEGTAGQLFSISDGLSGSIFSVNDISGIPSIEVLDTGLIKLNQYSGSTAFGSSAAIQSSSVNAKVSIFTVFPATPGLIIKAAASQTANLQEWQNASSVVKSKILADGSLFVGGGSYTKIDSTYGQVVIRDTPLLGSLTVGTGATSVIGLVIKGVASQTANLQEWQDSAGTVLSRIESGGAVNISPTSTPNGYSLYVIGAGSSGIVTMKSTATSAHAIQLQNSANTVVFKMDLEGRIVPSSASSTGLVVRSVASQTGNMQEWQNSSGTVLAAIGPNGTVYMGSNGSNNIANFYNGTSGYGAGNIAYNGIFNINGANMGFPYTSTGATLNVNAGASNIIPLTVKGVASQTANLQEWQNSAGTSLVSVQANGRVDFQGAYIDQYGQIVTNTTLYANNVYHNLNYWQLKNDGSANFNSQSATTKPLIVKGAASQTANLQEWQDSAGGTLSSVTNLGSIDISGASGASLASGTGLGDKISLYQNAFGIGIDYGRMVSYLSSATDAFAVRVKTASGIRSAGSDAISLFGNGSIVQTLSSASVVGLIIKGAASQTGDLQQWQNSAGTNLVRVSSSGKILIASDGEAPSSMLTISQAATSAVVTSIASTSSDYGLTLNATGSGNNTTVGMAFSAFASTGFNGTSTPGGAIWFTRTGSYSLGYLSFLTRSSTGANDPLVERMRVGDTGTISIAGFAAGSPGLVVKAAASQTANLQEWCNNSGTVISSISSYGGGRLYDLGIKGAPAGIAWAYFGNDSISTKNVVVRAVASQTANLQEWQDSAGTVLARITSAGVIGSNSNIYGNRFYYSGNGTSTQQSISFIDGSNGGGLSIRNIDLGTPNAGFDNVVPLSVSGNLNQTADLQRWTNSSGTVLTSISSTGKLTSAVDASINGVVIGMGAGSASTNTVVGLNSLVSNTTGTSNTAFGNQSLQLNTSGTQNTAFGQGALYNNRTGWYNTAFGQGALQNNNYAYSNTAIGTAAMITNVSGGGNTAIGIQSLLSNLSGSNNIGFGSNAGFSNSTGSGNIFLGTESGYYETGSNKLYIANTNTTTPLIGGDFSAKTLTIAGNATITSQATGTVGLIVKAIASQTANLTEWQNSAGTVRTLIDSGGGINTNANNNFNAASGFGGLGAFTNSSIIAISTNTASYIGLLIRGMASQTGDLQQWQNSAGTVIGKITADGGVNLASGSVDIREGGGNFTIRNAGTTAYFTNSSLLVGTGYSAGIGVIIRGNGSQTADLQQWQSSAGTVIVKVDAYGYITSNGAILPSGNGSFESAYGGAFMAMKKVTSAVANPVADVARMYLVAGTNAGTLKLVIKAGAAGAETTILDNIPQS